MLGGDLLEMKLGRLGGFACRNRVSLHTAVACESPGQSADVLNFAVESCEIIWRKAVSFEEGLQAPDEGGATVVRQVSRRRVRLLVFLWHVARPRVHAKSTERRDQQEGTPSWIRNRRDSAADCLVPPYQN